MVDTIATLAFAAAVTERVKLGSGIILLAQRNPVVLAKELSRVGAEGSTIRVRRAQIHEHLQEMGLLIPIRDHESPTS